MRKKKAGDRPPKAPAPSGRLPRLHLETADGESIDLGPARDEHSSAWAAAHEAGVAGRVAAPVFISYATPNRSCYVQPIIAHLRDCGFTAWADWRNIATGTPFAAEIEQGLHTCSAMLVVLTPTSIDPQRWVRREWDWAKGTYFVPILPLIVEEIEDGKYREIFGGIQYLKTAPTPKHRGVARFRRADLDKLREAIERLVLPPGRWMIDETPAVGRVFIGRATELRDLVKRLSYGVRVGLSQKTDRAPVVVEGVGGMGKTMLVSELARRIGPRYPGGVIFHSRTARTDPREVMRTWALELGKKLPANVTPQSVRRELAKAGPLLVVIDDVWADDFENVRLLCNEALPPGTERILTTRDSRLRSVIGGRRLRLQRLKEDDGIALLEDRLADSGPIPTRATLRRLVKAVGGHALALEVAAGQCVDNSAFLAAQTARLEKQIHSGQLSSVALGLRTDDRDDSVLFCFDLSLKDVKAADRRTGTRLAGRFAELAVLAEEAPFDCRTAAAIWRIEEDEAASSLLALSSRGLVTAIAGALSFKLHPLLHAYAIGLLKETPRKLRSAESRHLQHFVERLAEFEDKRWREFEVHAPNVALAAERAAAGLPEELAGALSRPVGAKAAGGYDRAAARRVMALALAAAHYVWHRRIHPGRRWLEAGLAAARLLRKPIAQAGLLTHLGVWHNDRGGREEALAYYRQALKIWRRYSDTKSGRSGLAWVLNNLGVLHRAIDEPDAAARYYREAIPIQEKLGLTKGLAISLGSLGVLCRDLGRHEEALRYYERSLAIEEEEDDLSGQSIVRNNIGRAYRDLGRPRKALEQLERALELAREAGNEAGVAIVLNNLGNVWFDLGEYEKSLDYFQRTLPIRHRTGDRPRLAVSYHNVGAALHAQGHDAEALASFDRALEVEEQVGDVAGRASTLYAEAALLFASDRPRERAQALGRLELARELLESKQLQRTSAGVSLEVLRQLADDWREDRATQPPSAATI